MLVIANNVVNDFCNFADKKVLFSVNRPTVESVEYIDRKQDFYKFLSVKPDITLF